MKFPFGSDIEVKREQETGETDRYGNPVVDWVTVATVRAAVADDSGAVSVTPGRIQIDYDYLLLLEPGQPEVLPNDRLTVRGKTCKPVRPEFDWEHPMVNWRPGSTVYVKAEVG